MKRQLYLLLVCLWLGFTGTSQSLYKLIYHFDTPEGREDYKALLLRNEDGTGLIRIAYFDKATKNNNLYEMDMVESYGEENGKEDKNMLIYVGIDPKQIFGKVPYDPDHFVFAFNPKTGFYEPDFVLSLDEKDKESIGSLDEVTLLEDKDLTQEFLLQFYTKDDEIFHNFFDEAETRSLTVQEKRAQLHLIVVANTNDKSIGSSCEVDKNATYNTFKDVAEYLGIGFKPTVISGVDFSKKNVDNAIQNLNPGPSDIVIFYYSGHGFNDMNDPAQYPFLDLRDKSYQQYGGEYTMNIETVYKNITAKNARLNLVISDCCNSDPTRTNNISSDGPTTRTSSIGWNMMNCKMLFMNPKPFSFLITAAAKGELSAGNSNKGGIFTFNFRESLEKFLGPFYNNANWADLVTNATKQTIATAKNTACKQADNSFRSCEQTPVYRMSK